ncbi:DUF559 domain-containing protein [Compostimonas suwonensis]|uniref:Uncharacterized protein DUF559 n=1 Tax=Compostimonas suwonensis TaxID=1048394 RepID=A0A2M9C4K2_9MICO|nr:DUF559 domain-containing protein [Compostimonas suwonensis]PJJ65455.1 uncharacterized protein DUF559 [Compostimonas suwonensis]
MPRRTPLPPALALTPFTTARAHTHGVGETRLRGGDLARPYHGVRAPGAAASGDPLQDACSAYTTRMRPTAFFSHDTAARLWGLPLPTRFDPGGELHVAVGWPRRAPAGRGIVGHALKDAAVTVRQRHGFRVVDPVSAWLSLGASLSPDDLVAVGDALVLDPVVVDPAIDPLSERPWATIAELQRRLDGFTGRGRRVLREALPLIREGSESRPESILRLTLGRAGLPEPEVNAEVHDGSGRFVGRGDLVYRAWKVVVEYDGDQHRTDSRQYDRDQSRVESFFLAGWTLVRVRKTALFRETATTVSRVHRALTARGWRGA